MQGRRVGVQHHGQNEVSLNPKQASQTLELNTVTVSPLLSLPSITWNKCPPFGSVLQQTLGRRLLETKGPTGFPQAHPPMRQRQEDMGVGQGTAMVREHEPGGDSVAIT